MSSGIETEKIAYLNKSYQRVNESLGINQDSSAVDIQTAIDHVSQNNLRGLESAYNIKLEDSKLRLLNQLEQTIKTLDSNGINDRRIPVSKDSIK